ncbi:MAG: magnesium/cobalt transporter CorA [Thermoleophilia bacterium]|nr:magnesium/cobalt transporter CorA [Thermoleophilia bacterium]
MSGGRNRRKLRQITSLIDHPRRLAGIMTRVGPRHEPGTQPGVMHVSEHAQATTIAVMAWKGDVLEELEATDLDHVVEIAGRCDVTWVDVEGLANLETLQALGTAFEIHPLVLEDITGVHSRPKLDRYDDKLFIVARMASMHGDDVQSEQLSIFLTGNVVLTFQEGVQGDSFEPVRRRIRSGSDTLRTSGSDFLMYSLLDATIDGYFPVLEAFGEQIEHLEDILLREPDAELMGRIHGLKREMLAARRAVWPLREVLTSLMRDETGVIAPSTRTYFFDAYDHCVQVIDLVETYRELASGLVDLYLSSMSNRMNEVMKVLTVITSIFIPLSFVVGLYGMNFAGHKYSMPELHTRYGYPIVLALLLLIVIFQLLFFRHRGWIGGSDKRS